MEGKVVMKRFLALALLAAVAFADVPAQAAGFLRVADPTVVLQAQRDRVTRYHVIITDAVETTLAPAGGEGIFLDLVLLLVSNESPTPIRAVIRDKTGGEVIFEFELRAGDFMALPIVVAVPQTEANNNWTVEISDAVTSIHVMAMTVSHP